ncbi:hypothetical protein PR202_ga29709 [Eleusine coracana subsp. coracana]|uniref:Protein kinase domain-containing protein n=1 Tax=Eleusine coracana subsp. coracana TaxID=191504 RepID=A0AAV5DM41_ELECO|nr:hypothetical protein PR202_ga29709 [Eleusine coracana subsp. coracana]
MINDNNLGHTSRACVVLIYSERPPARRGDISKADVAELEAGRGGTEERARAGVRLKHKNLIRLVIGVCLDEQERLLVYEYRTNRSLDLILFGSDENDEERRGLLDWEQGYRIVNGIARGFAVPP